MITVFTAVNHISTSTRLKLHGCCEGLWESKGISTGQDLPEVIVHNISSVLHFSIISLSPDKASEALLCSDLSEWLCQKAF